MNVESAGNWRMEVGTVTVVFIPIKSTATIAVKIFVRLAGALGAWALDCQRKRPVSRLTSAISAAWITGAGIGRGTTAARVAAGWTRVAETVGAGVTLGVGMRKRSDRRSTAWTGTSAAASAGVVVGWAARGVDADASVLPRVAVATNTAASRIVECIEGSQPSSGCRRKQEQGPYNVARAGMTE